MITIHHLIGLVVLLQTELLELRVQSHLFARFVNHYPFQYRIKTLLSQTS
jgi:hypothetical protein